jgi:integrase
LLLLTGQRLNEIAGLRWSEIDFEHDTITLPAERTKNGRQHLIPMSVPVRDILEAQPRRAGRELVFGFGQGPFSGWSKAKGELDERIAEARKKAKAKPMPAWVLHDLRRSAATGMAILGTQPHVVEAVLNHVFGSKSGVAGIYNLSTYEPEKRQALDIWANQITSGGSKIVPMKRQA